MNVLWRPVMTESLIIRNHQLAKVSDDPTQACSISIPEHAQPACLTVVVVCFKHTL